MIPKISILEIYMLSQKKTVVNRFRIYETYEISLAIKTSGKIIIKCLIQKSKKKTNKNNDH